MTPWVGQLIFANVVMYVLSIAFPALVGDLAFMPALVLSRPWTPLTYMFLHAGVWHLFFNMIALFFFGPRLEVRLGGPRFLRLYFISGLMGAGLSVLTPFATIVGASGAVFGVLLGFARYWPHERIYIWGVLPIEARVLVIAMTVLALWGGFGGSRDGIAHFAHLGGFLGGYLYLRYTEATSPARNFRQRATVTLSAKISDGRNLQRWSQIDRDSLHEANRDELDRILEKIRVSGTSSLTLREREFLDRFSAG
ncbi:MAG: rhomboid family intramembrane serine protease [Gemmatimonadota bacterium]